MDITVSAQEHLQNTCFFPCPFKMTRPKWKTALWLDESKCYFIFHFFENMDAIVLWNKEERDHMAYYQCSVQKPDSTGVH